jgi:putative phage-type endonuclease
MTLQQNTPEWRAFRRTKLGASDCPAIMGKSPYKTPYGVWCEKVLGTEQHVTAAMQRGTNLEAEARAEAERILGTTWTPEVVISLKYSWAMASLDGISSDRKSILEIKCPGSAIYDQFMEGNKEIPEHWLWQIQHQLAVTEVNQAILFVYFGQDRQSFTFHVSADQDKIDRLIEVETKFWFDHVCEEIPPELTDKDYVERNDSIWKAMVERHKVIQETLKYWEDQEKQSRDAIIKEAGVPSKGAGLKASKYYVRGNIDYKAIPELQGMNLDFYRKPGREQWRIT